MEKNELMSYVYDFTSQLIDNKNIADAIKKIILFGSTVEGNFHKKSDIDLFVEVKEKEEVVKKEIKKELNKFEERSEKTWHLRNIDFPINIITGDLNNKKWKDLKEEILNYSLIIYGKYEETPEKLNHKILITYDIKKLLQKNKMAFLRKLYGYVIKKENKKYNPFSLIIF